MIAFVTPEKRELAASLQRSLRLVGKSAGAISDLVDGHDATPQRRAQDLPGSGNAPPRPRATSAEPLSPWGGGDALCSRRQPSGAPRAYQRR